MPNIDALSAPKDLFGKFSGYAYSERRKKIFFAIVFCCKISRKLPQRKKFWREFNLAVHSGSFVLEQEPFVIEQ